MKLHGPSTTAAASLLLAATLSGRQDPPRRPPQALVPVSASTLAANPDPFIGMTVSLTAAVDQRYGVTAFSVDQDKAKSSGQDVLVLAPVLNAPVEPNTYVTVIGEVVRFDAAAVATRMKDAAPSLPADVAAKYTGRAAVIATSVINSAMTDLARRLPPPMTPAEDALSKVMKQVGPGFNALRQAATASNAADTTAQGIALKKLFTDSQAFWKTTPRPDAIQWAEDAKVTSDAIAAAATKGDWETVKTTVPKLQQLCASCHGVYRERLDDGTYRFKAPSGK
jgi:cytochrome c556